MAITVISKKAGAILALLALVAGYKGLLLLRERRRTSNEFREVEQAD